MTYDLLSRALRDTAARGDLASLRAFVNAEHPADMANFLGGLTAPDAWVVLGLMPLAEQAELFGYFGVEFQVELIEAGARPEVAALVGEMNADERADLFNALPRAAREALLPALAQAEREDLRRLAAHPEGTAGALMTSDYAVLTPELSAAAAIDKLRREAPEKETIYRAYVVDADRRLIGVARLVDLITAPAETPVSALMETQTLALPVDLPREEVARRSALYDQLALPVVDAEGRIVGIVTHDDAMDAAAAEATEDFRKTGAVGGLKAGLRDAGLLVLYRARIVWLLVLVFGNIFSGAGIAYFEDTITAYVALVFFLPLLIDSGGNAGSQSATLMVRALATGDVRMGDWGRMIGREAGVALLLGLTMAAAVSTIGVLRAGPEVALVVALSMVAIVLVGSVIGMSLPFVLNRVGVDPATASAPLVTSIADAAGVMIYFAIATALLFPAI